MKRVLLIVNPYASAVTAAEKLIAQHPDTKAGERAKLLLPKLREKLPPPPPDPEPPAATGTSRSAPT